MERGEYLVQQGVYNGRTVLCLRCKGMTYLPNHVFVEERCVEYMTQHDLWCPAVIDAALARLLG